MACNPANFDYPSVETTRDIPMHTLTNQSSVVSAQSQQEMLAEVLLTVRSLGLQLQAAHRKLDQLLLMKQFEEVENADYGVSNAAKIVQSILATGQFVANAQTVAGWDVFYDPQRKGICNLIKSVTKMNVVYFAGPGDAYTFKLK